MKLTSSVKTKITNDWAELFPALGVYKPMWLLRRVGPLVTGVCLDRDSGNDAYRPTFHVHSLAQPASSVSLTLAEPLLTVKTGVPETIRSGFHDQRFAEAAGRFRQQVPIDLDAAIGVSDILLAYRRYMGQPLGRYPLRLYEDVITLLLIQGETAQARCSFDEFQDQVAKWPESINVLRNAGGLCEWSGKCRSWLDNPGILLKTVDEQVALLGLGNIPASSLDSE